MVGLGRKSKTRTSNRVRAAIDASLIVLHASRLHLLAMHVEAAALQSKHNILFLTERILKI